MLEWIKEVGRGKRGAKDLSYEDMRRAAHSIITGEATPAQIGAFLMAERIKMESFDEICAFVDELRDHSRISPIADGIDCAGLYDGTKSFFMATVPTSFILAACGLPVTLHGSDRLPPKYGVSIKSVLEELGVQRHHALGKSSIDIARHTGVMFIPTEEWCPPLQALREIRRQVGVRTVLNTAEKLLRFSNAPYLAFGIYHGTGFDKMTVLLEKLKLRRAIIVQGMEGSEDIPVHRPTKTCVIRDGLQELFIVTPSVYGLESNEGSGEWTLDRQVATIREVLENKAEAPYKNMVLLNSAIRLWLAEKVESVHDGLELARNTLENGIAFRKFMDWRDA